MIISASRRTDIPAFFTEWFFNRLKEGFVLVRNPMRAQQVSKIRLSPEVVDGIVFWTKNPVPMMKRLKELVPYHYYFQFTLSAYGRDVEPNLPSKNKVLIPAFQELSRAVGREAVIWRYDPIFFNEHYDMEYHCRYFRVLASSIGEYTEKCTVSFLDFYQNTKNNMGNVSSGTRQQRIELLQRFAETAKEFGFGIDTCAEPLNLEEYGIGKAHCIDKEKLERISHCKLQGDKDKNQRPGCGCMESIDIGAYNTCRNGCTYCYANFNGQSAKEKIRGYAPCSPLLCSRLCPEDTVKEKSVKSFRDEQISLSDYFH